MSDQSNEFSYSLEDDDLISICSFNSCVTSICSVNSDSFEVLNPVHKSTDSFSDNKHHIEIMATANIHYGFSSEIQHKVIKCGKCRNDSNKLLPHDFAPCYLCKTEFCYKHRRRCCHCRLDYCLSCVKDWKSLKMNSETLWYCVYCEDAYKQSKKRYGGICCLL